MYTSIDVCQKLVHTVTLTKDNIDAPAFGDYHILSLIVHTVLINMQV